MLTPEIVKKRLSQHCETIGRADPDDCPMLVLKDVLCAIACGHPEPKSLAAAVFAIKSFITMTEDEVRKHVIGKLNA